MGGSSKKSTVGYKYYLGMHLALCHGPVSRLNQIIVGERVAFSGAVTYNRVSGLPADSEKLIPVNAPDLFGGKKKEGGVAGNVDICFGASNQNINAYLSSKLDPFDVVPIPAFRGITCLVLNQCYVAAGSPYPKPWWASLTRFPEEDWYEATADIDSGSANGAHIVRETLLNEDWGLGYPVEIIDDVSFKAVADTLYAEGFGLSYILAGQGNVEEFIQEVIKTVNGVLFTDRETGKFKLKLIRDDYVIGELLSLGPDNIIEYSSFQRAQPAEMINEISVIYRRKADYSDASSTFQDLASVVTQGAVISHTMQFPGIDTDENAALIGMRELKQHSTPLAQVVFTANRQAYNLNPGEAFIFTWPERGIEQLIMRAVKLDYGNLADGSIIVTAIEDVFGVVNASYITPQDSEWTDPIGDPTFLAIEDTTRIEVPHYLLAVNLDPGDYSALTEDSSFLIYAALFPAITGPSFQLWTSATPGFVEDTFFQRTTGTYTYSVNLKESITENDNNVDIEVSDFEPNFSNELDPDVAINSLCLIKSNDDPDIVELAILLDFDDTTDPNTIKLGRGALDTLPRSHISTGVGTTIWFFEDNAAFDPSEYSDGLTISTIPLPQTGTGILPFDDGFANSKWPITFTGRQYLPSPAAYVRIASTIDVGLYPTSVQLSFATTLKFYWYRGNRLLQTVPGVIPYFFGSALLYNPTTEENTVYRLFLYNEDNLDPVNPDTDSDLTLDSTDVTATFNWTEEPEYLEEPGPVPGTYRAYVPLATDGEILGGVDYSPAINQTNIVYHAAESEAEFNVGWMDIGDDLITTDDFTIILTVRPDSSISYTYVAKSAPTPALNDAVLYVGSVGSNLVIQSGGTSGTERATFTGVITPLVDQTLIINAQRDVPSVNQMTITVWKDNEYIDEQVITPAYTDITAGSDWSLGHYYGPSIGTTPYGGFMKEVYFFNSIITPYTTGILRKNNKVRFRLKGVRTEGTFPDDVEIESQDTFDWTFDRRGWTYNFDEYWNGDEA
ncbi:MAG: phage tail protein [Candidatus Humimicrobiaceae bacterium]